MRNFVHRFRSMPRRTHVVRPRVMIFSHQSFRTPCTLKDMPPRRNPDPLASVEEEPAPSAYYGGGNPHMTTTSYTFTITGNPMIYYSNF